MQKTALVQNAENAEEIFTQLGELGLRVGPRTGEEKRTQEEKELWCLRGLLEFLNENKNINWPLTIFKSESPDFYFTEGHMHYGLEITEAIPECDARERTLASKSDIKISFFGEHGGRPPTDTETAAKRIIKDVQNVIDNKAQKDYFWRQPTDLFIYVQGNDTMWLNGKPVDTEATYWKDKVCRHLYENCSVYRRIILCWESGDLNIIKDV